MSFNFFKKKRSVEPKVEVDPNLDELGRGEEYVTEAMRPFINESAAKPTVAKETRTLGTPLDAFTTDINPGDENKKTVAPIPTFDFERSRKKHPQVPEGDGKEPGLRS